MMIIGLWLLSNGINEVKSVGLLGSLYAETIITLESSG